MESNLSAANTLNSRVEGSLESLRSENQNLGATNEYFSNSLEESKIIMEELKLERSAQELEIAENREEIIRLNRLNEDLTNNLSSKDKEQEHLQNALLSNSRLQVELKERNIEIINAEKEIDIYKGENHSKEEILTQNVLEIESKEELIMDITLQITELREKMQILEDNLHTSEEKREFFENKSETRLTELLNVDNLFKEEQQRVAEQTQFITLKQNTIENLHSEIANLLTRLKHELNQKEVLKTNYENIIKTKIEGNNKQMEEKIKSMREDYNSKLIELKEQSEYEKKSLREEYEQNSSNNLDKYQVSKIIY